MSVWESCVIDGTLGRNVAAATRRVNPGHPVGAQRQSVSGEVGRVGGLLLAPPGPRLSSPFPVLGSESHTVIVGSFNVTR